MAALDYAKEANEKYQADIMRYREKYEYYDDDKLYQAFRRTSGVEKAVCAELLKERGYTRNTGE